MQFTGKLSQKTFIKLVVLVLSTTIAFSILILVYSLLDNRNNYTNLYSSAIKHFSDRTGRLIMDENKTEILRFFKKILAQDRSIEYIILERENQIYAKAINTKCEFDLAQIAQAKGSDVTMMKYSHESGHLIYHILSPISYNNYYIHIGLSRSKIDEEISDLIPPVILVSIVILIAGVILSWRITQQITRSAREMNEELINSEEKFRTIFETSPDAVAITNLENGEVVSINEGFTKLSGYSRKEILGRTVQELDLWVNIDDRALLTEELKQHGIVTNFVSEFRIKNCDIRFASLSAKVIHINKMPHMLTVVRDIHDRKILENELRAEKEILAITLRSIGDGVITTDQHGKILLINDSGSMIIRESPEKLIGKKIEDVFQIFEHNNEEEPPRKLAGIIFRNCKKSSSTHEVLLKVGERSLIIRLVISPILNLADDSVGEVAIFRDITNEKKIEQELRRTEKADTLSIVASGIAHDFNNHLAISLARISLLQEKLGKNKPEKEKLQQVEKSLQKATVLTDHLLTFSKSYFPHKEISDIKPLIKEDSEIVLSGSKIHANYDLAEDLWLLEIDRDQISQVLNNLILNAKQAMPNGGDLTISAGNVSISSNQKNMKTGDYIKLTISDTGTGVSKSDIEKIFDPYFSTKEQGHGLGLASTFNIIQKHDGYIEVESKPGKRTTFIIFLPAKREKIVSIPKKMKTIHRGTEKILLMDDEKGIQEATTEILTYLGYTVKSVTNSTDLLEEYKRTYNTKEKYDVTILDLTIAGGVGGLKTMEKLLEINPDVKAIISSGYVNNEAIKRYADYGFSGFLIKPFTINELSKSIHEIMNPEKINS